MSRAYQGYGTRQTPQNKPIPGKEQVPNSAGGYTFPVDCWTRLDRFLILGSEGGTYYIGERELTTQNASALMECLTIDGQRTVGRIVEISVEGRAAKNTPAIFALAIACASTDTQTRRLALDSVPVVCRTGTHLFQFATLIGEFRGWGRTLRRGIGNWYAQDPAKLAYQLIKYRQREGWTHKDMLRKAHPARTVSSGNPTLDTVTAVHERLYNWAVRREMEAMDDDELLPILGMPGGYDAERIVTSFERAMSCTTSKQTAALVRELSEGGFAIPREALHPEHLDAEVWTALLEAGMPMTALIRNLATMTRKGVIKPMDSRTKQVCDQLVDGDRLRKARVHPYSVLLAMATYGSGGRDGESRGDYYEPVTMVLDALDSAFYQSFGNVEPTGKRTMTALDVSGSMSQPILGRYDQRRKCMKGVPLHAREGAAAMAMVTNRVEPLCMSTTFSAGGYETRTSRFGRGYSNAIREFDMSGRRLLRDVIAATAQLPFGGTDCSLPMQYALSSRIPIDTFVVYTDNETWAGDIHPSQALVQYREQMGIAAKLVVVGMASNGFTIADPADSGMLDVVGFDTQAPHVISDFAA